MLEREWWLVQLTHRSKLHQLAWRASMVDGAGGGRSVTVLQAACMVKKVV